jgi:hypothetical protein
MPMLTTTDPAPPADATLLLLRVAPEQIVDLHSVLEGYDDLCVLLTLRPKGGLVEVRVSPGSEGELALLLDALAREGLPTVLVAGETP